MGVDSLFITHHISHEKSLGYRHHPAFLAHMVTNRKPYPMAESSLVAIGEALNLLSFGYSLEKPIRGP